MKAGHIMTLAAAVLVAILIVAAAFTPAPMRNWTMAVAPSLEDRLPDGAYYNPSTQSFLRGSHWLDAVSEVQIGTDRRGRGTVELIDPKREHTLTVQNLPLDQLVPRLHYRPASEPDAFDAYNLMLAEYSRNSLSVPIGKRSDTMAHFETNLQEAVPWTLAGDYQFVPNRSARPVRVSVVNNCLAPGLWELAAADRTGEIYHAWFDMAPDLYFDLVARTNGVDREFAEAAVQWRSEEVTLDLERLRQRLEQVGETSCTLIYDVEVGFSSQDSRRKLHKHFVEVQASDGWRAPVWLSELTDGACRFSDFMPPGKYSLTQRKPYDLRFLRTVRSAHVSRVKALTHYDWLNGDGDSASRDDDCLEVVLDLDGFRIVLGNLPTALLVPQEDFVIPGFGVGVLSSSEPAERRSYLVSEGPPPSFAYLCRNDGDRLVGVNSHDHGIEQVFIRTHVDDAEPWWEITITSYERIVDLVKYHVRIPESIQEELKQRALSYVSPLYRTYRDDNLR